jgi:hypothetical protein
MNLDHALKLLLTESLDSVVYVTLYINEEEAERQKKTNLDIFERFEYIVRSGPEGYGNNIKGIDVVNNIDMDEIGNGKMIIKIKLDSKSDSTTFMNMITRFVAPEEYRDLMNGLVDEDYKIEPESEYLKRTLSKDTRNSFGGLIDVI